MYVCVGMLRITSRRLRGQRCTQSAYLVEIKVVDIWTDYAMWPSNRMAAGYPFVCKHPWIWRSMYYTTMALELPWQAIVKIDCNGELQKWAVLYKGFRKALQRLYRGFTKAL